MFTTIIDSTLSSTISTNVVGLPDYHNVALVTLGSLLGFRYILSGSNCWEEFLDNSLNMGIFPLLLSFSWAVIYTILSLL